MQVLQHRRGDTRRAHRPHRAIAATALVLGAVAAFGAAVAGAWQLGSVQQSVLSSGSFPAAITAGSDGNVWFSDRGIPGIPSIHRITTAEPIVVTDYPLTTDASPRVIAQGNDGNLWFADASTINPGIGRITTAGLLLPKVALAAGSSPDGVTSGPDANVWFTDRKPTHPLVGKIDPSTGTILQTWDLPLGSSPHAIAVGPDGSLWFADAGTPSSPLPPAGVPVTPGAIGKVTTDGAVTKYSTGLNAGSMPDAIVQGADGYLWFTDIGTTKAVGRIDTQGSIVEFSFAGVVPRGIAVGADGKVWFTDQSATSPAIRTVATDGTITAYPTVLTAGSDVPFRIATGADGNLWFSDSGTTRAVWRAGVGATAASVAPPAIGGRGYQGVSQTCSGDLWSDWAGRQPSHDAFAFDGYQWLLDGSPIAGQTSQTYTPGAADVGHELTCKVTVTYTLFTATVAATSEALDVVGPAGQIADLADSVVGVGPGGSLHAKLQDAGSALAANDTGGACSILRAFLNQVAAQSGKSIPTATAASLTADATRIRSLLGC